MFEFHCDNKRVIRIMLEGGTLIYYGGHTVTHRQTSRPSKESEKNIGMPIYWNIATYGNNKYVHT